MYFDLVRIGLADEYDVKVLGEWALDSLGFKQAQTARGI
jgi:hypothetical protein